MPQVRLIDEKGNNIGVVDIDKALAMSKEAGLDLIEISKDAKPPVVRIMDMGKYLYQKEKAKKENKAKQKATEIKIIKIGPAISEHDAKIKIKKLAEFLEEGHKVKVEIFLKGRLRANQNFAREKFENFLKMINVAYKVDQPTKRLPSGFVIILSK